MEVVSLGTTSMERISEKQINSCHDEYDRLNPAFFQLVQCPTLLLFRHTQNCSLTSYLSMREGSDNGLFQKMASNPLPLTLESSERNDGQMAMTKRNRIPLISSVILGGECVVIHLLIWKTKNQNPDSFGGCDEQHANQPTMSAALERRKTNFAKCTAHQSRKGSCYFCSNSISAYLVLYQVLASNKVE